MVSQFVMGPARLPKRMIVRSFRITERRWQQFARLAAQEQRDPTEYLRLLVEQHIMAKQAERVVEIRRTGKLVG